MQKLLIGLVLLTLGALAYLALGGTGKSSKATFETSEESESSESSNTAKENARDFVAPRRMRSRSSLSEDELSDPSIRKMNQMGRGGDLRSNKSNRLAGSEPSSEADLEAREQRRAEVVARRTRQWISDADKDSDGLLNPSEAELGSPSLRRVLNDFEAADTNGDGVINSEELVAATHLHRKRRQEQRLEGGGSR